MDDINNVKIAKFELLLRETNMYLMDSVDYSPSMALRLPLKKEYDNCWVKTVLKEIFYNPNFECDTVENLKKGISELNTDGNYILIRDDNYAVYMEYPFWYLKNALVFWSLFLAAIDDEFYENEIDMISDLASALKFTPEMILDWSNAVKYVLEGNVLSKSCDLKVNTNEAKRFFLS